MQIKAIYVDGRIVGHVEVTGDYEADAARARQFLKDRGLYRQVTTLRAMFRQAMAFGQAALMLNDQVQAAGARGASSLLTTPFVVNQVFSVELLLKTLAAAHGVQLTGHNLSKLLAKQPAAALAAIDEAIVHLCNTAPRPEPWALCLGPLPPPGASRALLENTLRDLAEAFVKWRYSYETGRACRVNIPSALWVATVLERACIDSGANK